jgi:hypothetical protein
MPSLASVEGPAAPAGACDVILRETDVHVVDPGGDPVLDLPADTEDNVVRRTSQPTRRSILAAIALRSGPHLIEATVIPAILFYFCLIWVSITVAILVALGWSYTAVIRRLVRHRPVPPILVLAVAGISVRTLIALGSGSSFVYFFQPILSTVVIGAIFLLSLAVGRPLVGRLASEFCPLTPEVVLRPAVARLFRGLTVLWAGVNLASATTTLILLLFLPVATFVAAKTISGLFITCGGIALTVSWSLRTARREGLVPALADACVETRWAAGAPGRPGAGRRV